MYPYLLVKKINSGLEDGPIGVLSTAIRYVFTHQCFVSLVCGFSTELQISSRDLKIGNLNETVSGCGWLTLL
jgi:hypothetical protein